ncbi:MAG: hypothetical protein DSY42_00690 [Aquifex sp.]|nr:MAG: hypothetical protein DSY42_00690 [Aquifex sp.]
MGALLSQLLAYIFNNDVARFIALKTLLVTLFIVALPIVLNNFLYELIDLLYTFMSSHINESGSSFVVRFTGLTAWLLSVLKIPDAFSVIMSAVMVRVTLDHIPFLRV